VPAWYPYLVRTPRLMAFAATCRILNVPTRNLDWWEFRSLTSKPFAIELVVSRKTKAPEHRTKRLNRSLAPLPSIASESRFGRHLVRLDEHTNPYSPIRLKIQARVLLRRERPVFSFHR